MLSGLAGRSYELSAAGADYVDQITGVERNGNFIQVSMPSGNRYVRSTVEIQLR